MRGDVIGVNCASMLLKGTKSVSELQNAVNGLVRINDAFRLRITESDGIISQYIADYTQQCFDVLEFENEAQLHTYADSFSKVPVGLYSELCVFKIVILPDHFGIIAKLHHLISDAWTFGLLATQFDILINGGDVTAGRNVECEDVTGDVTAGGKVTCKNVEGDVTAGSSVEIEDINN